LLTALLVMVASTVSAQMLKIGFINDDKIKDNYKPWQRVQEEWNVQQKAWNDEANSRQQELQEMLDEYDKQKLILSEEKRKEREAAIRAKQESLDAFTRQVFGPNGTAERKQIELLEPLINKINEAIKMVAEEEGYDVIFTLRSNLGYIKEDYDITDKVLAKLEEIGE
jgi:outer membrane protein